MKTTLHLIQSLSRGGASRALITLAKSLTQGYCHQIISLDRADPRIVALAAQSEITTLIQPDPEQLQQAIESADLIQIHFWNNPEIYDLLRLSLPPLRLGFWLHIAGDTPPQVITPALLSLGDLVVATSPYTTKLTVFQSAPKTAMIYSVTDKERLKHLEKQPHDTFNVGYIGTANPVKMHPRYLEMSAEIEIPNLKLIVCGGESDCQTLAKTAQKLGIRSKFDFRGYVEDIASVIAELDVFGYPLCPENYSTVELVLQEVMLAGIPPVIFAFGGAQDTVIHKETGLVVETEAEYQAAIAYLYTYPQERHRFGRNARKYAQETFKQETLAQEFDSVYRSLLAQPKREFIPLPTVASGAEALIQSLGETAPQFEVSLKSANLQQLWVADEKIAKSPPILSGGGILSYQSYYPQDSYLKFWSGLVWQQQGQNVRAIAMYKKAIQLGFNHWRIHWYTAQVARKVKAISLIKQSLKIVRNAAPDFVPAQKMWESNQEL
ncbi:MAG: glycosyltransferase family 4 protein [Oscillatoria sp. PMC 1068.18]|nr:glycosyltransferase family 4 protein [Oscillatoria sp. PMC 1076.18]MEC4988182.1 glycosyltransferase family 4 protein [Oscillatoria sp. PMC 1068.18]